MSSSLKLLWVASVALILGVVLGVATFGTASPKSSQDGSSGGERIILITHGQAADPYWNIVRNGAEEAARQLGVDLEYRAPETFDMIRMAELIKSATNQRPDGHHRIDPRCQRAGPVDPGRGAIGHSARVDQLGRGCRGRARVDDPYRSGRI